MPVRVEVVMVKVMDCMLKLSKFKLKSRYYVHSQIYIWKIMDLCIYPLFVEKYHSFS